MKIFLLCVKGVQDIHEVNLLNGSTYLILQSEQNFSRSNYQTHFPKSVLGLFKSKIGKTYVHFHQDNNLNDVEFA